VDELCVYQCLNLHRMNFVYFNGNMRADTFRGHYTTQHLRHFWSAPVNGQFCGQGRPNIVSLLVLEFQLLTMAKLQRIYMLLRRFLGPYLPKPDLVHSDHQYCIALGVLGFFCSKVSSVAGNKPFTMENLKMQYSATVKRDSETSPSSAPLVAAEGALKSNSEKWVDNAEEQECKTPKSEENKIPPVLTCPGAPRKPKSLPSAGTSSAGSTEAFYIPSNDSDLRSLFESHLISRSPAFEEKTPIGSPKISEIDDGRS